MEQRILEINAGETAWLGQLIGELTERGIAYLDIHALGRYYDEAAAAWAATDPADREDPNGIVNRTGAGLGEHLRTRLPLRWVVVTDDLGTDLVVHGQPGNVVLPPMVMVAKRWYDGTTGFLPGLADFAVQQADALMRAGGGSGTDGFPLRSV